jgi:hypothetical protein
MPTLTLIRAELETALAHLAAADGADLDFQSFARLDLARQALNRAAKFLGSEIAEGDETIQTMLMNAGFASVKLDDPPATMSVGGQLWAGVAYRHHAECCECDWSAGGPDAKAEAAAHKDAERHEVRVVKEATDDGYTRALAALKDFGLGHFEQRRFDTKVLSSYFREVVKDDPDFELPPELSGAIKLTERFKVKVTKRSR